MQNPVSEWKADPPVPSHTAPILVIDGGFALPKRNAYGLGGALQAGYILAPGQPQLSQPLALRGPQPFASEGLGPSFVIRTPDRRRASSEHRKEPGGEVDGLDNGRIASLARCPHADCDQRIVGRTRSDPA